MTTNQAGQYNPLPHAGHPSMPDAASTDGFLAEPASWDGAMPDTAVMEAHQRYPMRFPRAFLAHVAQHDPADPLWRQGYPSAEELLEVPGFSADPLLEGQHTPLPGMIQKYPDRVLLLVSNRCAIHCRFCFRRHRREEKIPPDWRPILTAIRQDTRIREVIYSGGDPLMASDAELAALTRHLADIPHLRRLRIHTRVPVALPERITSDLLAWLTGSRLQPVVVLHVNHPAELGASARTALRSLANHGIPLLQQAVLLQGVNDSATTLLELYAALIDLGIIPYYLHLLDPVAGAAHFQVTPERGVELLASLRERLPGYAIPRLVRDNPNGGGKERL
ncbi:MAG: KamA family radical SAM protein [Magnetococcales bacterium]|nr:KamA family radical SAM protein [Magnetococcales bacterium]